MCLTKNKRTMTDMIIKKLLLQGNMKRDHVPQWTGTGVITKMKVMTRITKGDIDMDL